MLVKFSFLITLNFLTKLSEKGWIRTNDGVVPTDLQSAALDLSATFPCIFTFGIDYHILYAPPGEVYIPHGTVYTL